MKTTIEVNGFEIKIEELEGKIVVSAEKEGEVIEEFELEAGETVEAQPGEGEEMMPFGDEEEDFGQAQDEDEEDFGQAQEEAEGKLESFMSFMQKRKK